jgi:hypothetical protein
MYVTLDSSKQAQKSKQLNRTKNLILEKYSTCRKRTAVQCRKRTAVQCRKRTAVQCRKRTAVQCRRKSCVAIFLIPGLQALPSILNINDYEIL